jgi:flagellar basal-body rod protein FlgB
MLKASEVSRQHNLDIGVVRSFDRMLKLAVRSGS